MKITRLETVRVAERANLLWLLVHTDEGLTGLGETFFGAETVEAYIHEYVAPRVIGRDPLEIDRLAGDLVGYVGFRSSGAEIAGVFHCPSADDGHPDRKPNPGLFLKAAAAHGLDMKACVSVGDRERDIRAALAAGVGRNFLFSAEDVPTLATARVETLEEVAARL